jgi:hypothetical protein
MEIEEFFALPLKNSLKPPLTMGMTAHDRIIRGRFSGLPRWLGIGSGDRSVREESDDLGDRQAA